MALTTPGLVETVWCKTHGEQQQTMVCQHVADGMISRTRTGFFWTSDDPSNPRPDAWCRNCEARVREAEGEWVGDALEYLQPKILCGGCYDAAKVFHTGGNPWS